MTRFQGDGINAHQGSICEVCGKTYRDHYMENCPAIMPLAAHKSEGKPLVADMDPDFVLAIGAVLESSVEKYPNDADGTPNWWKGGSYKGFTASILRHALKYLSGEDIDPESGKPHMDHIGTDAMFIASWQRRGVGADDRLKGGYLR